MSDSWKLELDSYERNNLLVLLILCGAGLSGNGVEPFTLMNNGDWLNQLWFKLEGDVAHGVRGNMTVEEIRRMVEEWSRDV